MSWSKAACGEFPKSIPESSVATDQDRTQWPVTLRSDCYR